MSKPYGCCQPHSEGTHRMAAHPHCSWAQPAPPAPTGKHSAPWALSMSTQPLSSAIYLLSVGSHTPLGPRPPATLASGGITHHSAAPRGTTGATGMAGRSWGCQPLHQLEGIADLLLEGREQPGVGSGQREARGKSSMSPALAPCEWGGPSRPPPIANVAAAPMSFQLLFRAMRRMPRASLGHWLCFYLRNASCLDRDPRTSPPPQVQGCVSGTRSCRVLSSPSCTNALCFSASPGPSAGWKDH